MANEVQLTYETICSFLDYREGKGLITNNSKKNKFQEYILNQATTKLGIDSILFVESYTGPNVPLVYIKKFQSYDPSKFSELHKKFWNLGQAPLLFVVCPESICIYSGYEPPKINSDGTLDHKAGLIQELHILIKAGELIKDNQDKLKLYHRSEMVSGNYWKKQTNYFNRNNRIYYSLLDNLEYMEKELIKSGINSEISHTLLIRSIFIKYFEDRKDLNGKNIFPDNYFNKYIVGAKSFTNILVDKKKTYKLFKDLNKKFNGDIFALENNEEIMVKQNHLLLLREMLEGNAYMKSKQKTLWPLYSFDVIPIELISNFYQQTVRDEERENTPGIHYTPLHLVSFLMDECLPWEGTNYNEKILDPACGSGIFLVEGFRRLISHWMQKNSTDEIDFTNLRKILTENIFGIDLDEKAIKITALSLYLTLCEYLTPEKIWDNKFMKLINKNLIISDFFDTNLNNKFSLIIGNPPWGSALTESAKRYLNKCKKPIADNQISLAFLWKVSEFGLDNNTKILMIVPSKSLLFNQSNTHLAFRKEFFSTNNIKWIINFSALRGILFPNAVAPAAAIYYESKKPDLDHIAYISPKPIYTNEDDWSFNISPIDIAYISREESINDPNIWKIAMWGSPRDLNLIKKLQANLTLKDYCKNNKWIDGEGYIKGKNKLEYNLAFHLLFKPIVDTDSLKRFTIDEDTLPQNWDFLKYRSANTKKNIFLGPHLLIKQSPSAGEKKLTTALVKKDAIFPNAILGIHSELKDLNLLCTICLILNSKIPLYYSLMTSRSWLIERDFFQKSEIMDIPIPESLNENQIDYDYLNQLSNSPDSDKKVESEILKLYGISKLENIIINDALDIILDYFWNRGESKALKKVDISNLRDYANVFIDILNKSFSNSDKKFKAVIFYREDNDYPIIIISFILTKSCDEELIKEDTQNISKILEELDYYLITEEKSTSIYIKKFLRRYTKNSIDIIKPNEIRYWTKSQAIRDADDSFKEIMISGRQNHEWDCF